jgi:hypothetical protein
MAGRKVGLWTVLKRAAPPKGTPNRAGFAFWLCRCACGTEKPVNGSLIRSGKSTGCGCERRVVHIEGRKFGRLRVLHRVGKPKGGAKHAYWLCRCDCGTEKVISGPYLRGGSTRSCGCLQADTSLENLKLSHTPEIHAANARALARWWKRNPSAKKELARRLRKQWDDPTPKYDGGTFACDHLDDEGRSAVRKGVCSRCKGAGKYTEKLTYREKWEAGYAEMDREARGRKISDYNRRKWKDPKWRRRMISLMTEGRRRSTLRSGGSRFTPEQCADIVAMRAEKYTYDQIAKKHGAGVSEVAYVCKKHRAPKVGRQPQKPKWAAQEKQIPALWDEGSWHGGGLAAVGDAPHHGGIPQEETGVAHGHGAGRQAEAGGRARRVEAAGGGPGEGSELLGGVRPHQECGAVVVVQGADVRLVLDVILVVDVGRETADRGRQEDDSDEDFHLMFPPRTVYERAGGIVWHLRLPP